MKSNVTTPKMAYLQPVCTFVNVQAESHILTISATTTNREFNKQVQIYLISS